MTPIQTCLRSVDQAARNTDSSVVQYVLAALDELEGAYPSREQRTLALTKLLQGFSNRRAHACGTPFHRFLSTCVEQRQARMLPCEASAQSNRGLRRGRGRHPVS